jgi:MOSC domain-containing protein YiiM
MQPQVISVNVGKPQTYKYQGKELSTGIFKSPVSSPLHLHSSKEFSD